MSEKTKKTLWKVVIGVTCAVVILASGSTAISNIKDRLNKKDDDKKQQEEQTENTAYVENYVIDDAAVL